MKALPRVAWLVFWFALCGFAFGAAPRDADDEQVLKTDEKRIHALINNDAQALAEQLSDDLVYGHSDGRVQSKEQLLAALASNRMQYRSVKYVNRDLKPLGNARALTGVADIEVNANGAPLSFTIRFLAVYVNEGGRWRLAAYQSTQILPPKT